MRIKNYLYSRSRRFFKEIFSSTLSNNELLLKIASANRHPSTNNCNCYLGNGLMLCKMHWGGFVVVPSWNIDVAIGAIRDGEIEQSTTKFMRTILKPDSSYINVGSNFGYYPALAGTIIGEKGKIYSFEANPIMFAILLRTAFYSGIINKAELYNRAVSDISNMDMELNFDYQFIGGGGVSRKKYEQAEELFWSEHTVHKLLDENGKYVGGGLYKTVKVKTIKLDDVINVGIDIIQTDAEGSDPLILLGGQNIIRKSPNLKIVFEWSGIHYRSRDEQYKNKVIQMWELLNDEGFSIRHIIPCLDSQGNNTLSAPLTLDDFLTAVHGDYYAVRNKAG